MKKGFFVILSIIICIGVLGGCFKPPTPAVADQSASPSSSQAVDTSDAPGKDYLSWSKNEWDAASEQDKIAASTVLMKQLDETIAKQSDEALKAVAELMVSTIDLFFAENPQATLKEAADQIKDFMPQQ